MAVALFFMGLSMVGTIFSPNSTTAIVTLILGMFSFGISGAVYWALATDVLETPRLVASVASIQNFGGFLGGALAPVFTGYLVDRFGGFDIAIGVAGAFGFVSALLYGFAAAQAPADLRSQMKNAVLVNGPYPAAELEKLRTEFDVHYCPDPADLASAGRRARRPGDGRARHGIDGHKRSAMRALPHLRLVINRGAGIDKVDMATAPSWASPSPAGRASTRCPWPIMPWP